VTSAGLGEDSPVTLRFASEEAAQNAVKTFNNYKLNGRIIEVRAPGRPNTNGTVLLQNIIDYVNHLARTMDINFTSALEKLCDVRDHHQGCLS
jgi:RNA recognition motif-containing protein